MPRGKRAAGCWFALSTLLVEPVTEIIKLRTLTSSIPSTNENHSLYHNNNNNKALAHSAGGLLINRCKRPAHNSVDGSGNHGCAAKGSSEGVPNLTPWHLSASKSCSNASGWLEGITLCDLSATCSRNARRLFANSSPERLRNMSWMPSVDFTSA
eukprot:EG_transcript_34329